VRDCLAGDHEFGVVLIERGSEVGGDDVRTDVGTVARITEAIELPDGRWALAAVGTRRLRVRSWLPDDPYPIADVDEWPDADPSPRCAPLADEALRALRRALALATEAGDVVAPATVELADDPLLMGYQATAVAPLGPHDRQALLAAATPEGRLEALTTLLADAIEALELRLGGG
jgi:Lon protease-like protein